MMSQLVCVARSEFRSRARRALRSFALLSLCGLLGCAQAQLELQSDALNRASAATISEHVLLNAVRASLDLPMSFTKLTKYTTENMAKGSLTPKIPFGPDALKSYDIGPTVNVSSGVFAIEYVDINTAGALAKLNQVLEYDAVHRYTAQGMPLILSSTIFVEHYEVHEILAHALKAQIQKKCRGPKKDANCDELDDIVRGCPRPWDDDSFKFKGHTFHLVQNRAQSRCDFLRFQSFLLTLRLSGYYADLHQDTTYQKFETPEKKIVPIRKTEISPEVIFQEEQVNKTFAQVQRILKPYKDRAALKILLRSPRSILTYLGELIALQNFSHDRYEPKVMVRSGKTYQPITAFRVIRGNPGPVSAALTVTGPHGDSYFVPHPEYGSHGRDQTLRVLSITAEVVNAAISEKDFPPPTSVTVRAVQ